MRLLMWTLLFACCIPAMAQQKGEVILKTDFNENDTPLGWSGTSRYKLVAENGITALRIQGKNHLLHLSIPVEKVRGAKLYVRTRVKAHIKTELPHPWNGAKLMLYVRQPWNEVYNQEQLTSRDFDWKENGFYAFVPPLADSVSLVIGLEEVKGKVWYDNLEVTVVEPPVKINKNIFAEKLVNKHETEFRGTMVNTFIDEEGIKTLASWGANHIRWQLTWNGFPNTPADNATYDEYRKWLDSALAHLDKMLPLCRQYGIKIVLDLHTLPGGYTQGVFAHKIFTDAYWQQKLPEIWRYLASRYKDEPTIWAYDIVNEPIEGIRQAGVMSWSELATTVVKEIKAVDTTHQIIIEASPSGLSESLVCMEPLPIPGLIYSFHMYLPGEFTHQGIASDRTDVRYPGFIFGREWNIATMREALQPVKDWQEHFGARIYVGEFSAARWTPGESSYYYLRDCITLFEEFGWDWAYHAFREYDGWSVEHTNNKNDPNPSKEPTERQKLLISSFKLNKK